MDSRVTSSIFFRTHIISCLSAGFLCCSVNKGYRQTDSWTVRFLMLFQCNRWWIDDIDGDNHINSKKRAKVNIIFKNTPKRQIYGKKIPSEDCLQVFTQLPTQFCLGSWKYLRICTAAEYLGVTTKYKLIKCSLWPVGPTCNWTLSSIIPCPPAWIPTKLVHMLSPLQRLLPWRHSSGWICP